MALVIEDAFLPATLTSLPMTDEEFAAFCAEHPDLFFEMTAEGEIIVMPPTFSLTGAQNSEIISQLRNWARRDARGIATGSSDGFVLPNGARRSPDAAWTLKTAIEQLSAESLASYWHLCPAFVIELRSNSDRIRALREKMREYIANGAHLAWLIDPQTRTVEVYRPGREPEILEAPTSVSGEGPVEGFRLELGTVWDPFASDAL